MRRRVVITGIGCVNPLGNDVESMWAGVKEGRSGVGYTTVFDASKFPTKISAEVKNWDITDTGEDPEIWKHRARHTRPDQLTILVHYLESHIPRTSASTDAVGPIERR